MNYLILKAVKHLSNSFTKEEKWCEEQSSISLGIWELQIKSIVHGIQIHIQITASQKSKEYIQRRNCNLLRDFLEILSHLHPVGQI